MPHVLHCWLKPKCCPDMRNHWKRWGVKCKADIELKWLVKASQTAGRSGWIDPVWELWLGRAPGCSLNVKPSLIIGSTLTELGPCSLGSGQLLTFIRLKNTFKWKYKMTQYSSINKQKKVVFFVLFLKKRAFMFLFPNSTFIYFRGRLFHDDTLYIASFIYLYYCLEMYGLIY